MTEKKTSSIEDKFKSKKRKTKTIPVVINGEALQVEALALSEKETREVQAKHPPQAADRDRGMLWNEKTFPPALCARSITTPSLSEEEWAEIWASPDWSQGELRELFNEVYSTTLDGFDVPFGKSG